MTGPFKQSGPRTVSVNVTEPGESSGATATLTVQVGDKLRGSISGPSEGQVGQAVQLTAQGENGRPPYEYTWSAGGRKGEVLRAKLTGQAGDQKTVTVTIKDADNNTATASHSIRVTAAPPKPPAALDATGSWIFDQGNYRFPVQLRQQGNTLSGSATLNSGQQQQANLTSPTGSVSGTLQGDQITVDITWPAKYDGSRSVGCYRGTLTSTRILNGSCFDRANPGRTARFTGSRH